MRPRRFSGLLESKKQCSALMSCVMGSFFVWLTCVLTMKFESDSTSSQGPSDGMIRAETTTCIEESTPSSK